jgi:hypothetical protein
MALSPHKYDIALAETDVPKAESKMIRTTVRKLQRLSRIIANPLNVQT